MLSVAESLLGEDWEDNDYSKTVADGAAIERLLSDRAKPGDFAVYQRRMTVELALVIRKAMMADSEQARSVAQGAMLQQLRVMKLPQDIVERAAKAVDNRRRESEEGESDGA